MAAIGPARSAETSDIFGGQPADQALLAELYDLEHDEITEDLAFYRAWTQRIGAASVLDLGCAPGSWMQYAAAKVGPRGKVIGYDLVPVKVSLPPQVPVKSEAMTIRVKSVEDRQALLSKLDGVKL